MKKNPISALVITYNEESNIAEFLKSVSFADEIVILDSYSTDKTLEIARAYPRTRVYQRRFEDFSTQRNRALDLATYQWVLFIDADERVDRALNDEILKTVRMPDTCEAYYVYRRFHFAGKALRYSGFQKDKAPILFKKNHCFYEPSRRVHEKLYCQGKIAYLKNKLDHYTYFSWEQYDAKLGKYARIQADELFEKNVQPRLHHFILKPFFRFFNHYLFKGGIFDGWQGFFISWLCGYYVFRRYVFLWMRHKNLQ